MQLNVKNETSTLKAVVLGQPGSIGKVPTLDNAQRIGAGETYFIHMSHHMGLHADAERLLPPHVHFAYDGMRISL